MLNRHCCPKGSFLLVCILVLALLPLGACAPNHKRDRLATSKTQDYERMQNALKKEQDTAQAMRSQEHTLLESVTKPVPPAIEPVAPTYNPLEETRISISVRSEPLNDVLFVVVRNAGLDLVVDPLLSLDNLVTISFENAPTIEIVRSLLEAYDVFWTVRDNVLIVRRFEERTFNLEFMNSRAEVTMESGGDIFGSTSEEGGSNDLAGSFKLNSSMGRGAEAGSFYGVVENDVRALLVGQEGSVGSFSLNPVSGSLYVQTTPKRMAAVANMVDRLRFKLSKQVIIDARILEVTLEEGFDLGVDWNFVQTRVNSGRTYSYGLGVNPETGLGTRGPSDPTRVSAIVLGDPAATATSAAAGAAAGATSAAAGAASRAVDSIFQATVNALQTFGGVKVVSNPHVRARHGVPALVTSGTSKRYIRNITRTTTDSQNSGSRDSVSTETASAFEGVMLGVVPFVGDDGTVDLDIFPVTSRVDLSTKEKVGEDNLTMPVVDIRNVSTNVRAHDGDTIILGGLIYKDSTKTDKAVPGMADAPALGWLFNSRKDAESTRELVIIMHIRIVG